VRYAWKNEDPAKMPANYALTRWTFTGQYAYVDDPTTSAVEDFGLMYYNARWFDPYINRMSQPDTIVPDPYNTQDYDRYIYVRNNPINATDPTGHYTCTGSNDKWGKDQTCYDVIQTWLDFLYTNGGEAGKLMVEAFMKADNNAPIFIEFAELNSWAKTDNLNGSITISSDVGLAEDYGDLGYQSSLFGHELFHLLEQDPGEMGTAESEKSAYDSQAKLLKNMDIELKPDWMVSKISSYGTSKEDMESIAAILQVQAQPTTYNKIMSTLGPASASLRGLLKNLSGCFQGNSAMVCYAPGPYDSKYTPQTP
jgi:RHS repeat-associated protein